MKVRVFSSSQKAQCCVAPITHCTTPRLLGLKSIYPKGHAPPCKMGLRFFLTNPFYLPSKPRTSFNMVSSHTVTCQAPGQPNQPVSSDLLEGQLSVWIIDRSWQCCRPAAFPFHTLALGHWDLALTATEFHGNMFRICLIGFVCWSEDRLGVEDDVIWQMCVIAFAMASHQPSPTNLTFLFSCSNVTNVVRFWMWIPRQVGC